MGTMGLARWTGVLGLCALIVVCHGLHEDNSVEVLDDNFFDLLQAQEGTDHAVDQEETGRRGGGAAPAWMKQLPANMPKPTTKALKKAVAKKMKKNAKKAVKKALKASKKKKASK